MGNTSSTGRLSLVLDPPPSSPASGGAYVAGQLLTGSLYAVSNSSLSAPPDVGLYLSGKERSRVRYTETQYYTDANGDRKSRTVTRYRYADRQIVRMPIPIGASTADIDAGTRYRFPFQIQLPHDLPSTMRCEESHYSGGYCEISYKVKSELRAFGSRSTEQIVKVLAAPLPPEQLPHLIEPMTKRVNICCCFNAGSMTLGARVENTRIGSGDAVAIDFACKNDSTQMIQHALAQIVEEVRWRAGGHENSSKRTIATQTFRKTERWERVGKEEAREMRAKSRSQTESYRDKQEKLYKEIYRAISDGENRAELIVPASTRHSYRGQLFTVNHHLKIKVQTGQCIDNPKTKKLLVHIGTSARLLGDPNKASWPSGNPPPHVPGTKPVVPSAPPAPVKPSAPPAEWADSEGSTPLVTATPVVVGSSVAVLGGAIIVEAEEDGPSGSPEDAGTDEAFGTAVVHASVVPTLPNLLKELEYSVNPITTIRQYIGQEDWNQAVFDELSPSGYAAIIKVVSVEFDQPEMAATLAPAVRGGEFSSEYIVAALRCVSSWLRITVVQKLLPFCQDLDQNASKILSELSDWERVCTQRDFENAMKE